MTWPDGIALAVGITTAFLVTHPHTHRSTTQPLPRTEANDGHQHPQGHPGEEDRSQDAHEDGSRPGPEGR